MVTLLAEALVAGKNYESCFVTELSKLRTQMMAVDAKVNFIRTCSRIPTTAPPSSYANAAERSAHLPQGPPLPPRPPPAQTRYLLTLSLKKDPNDRATPSRLYEHVKTDVTKTLRPRENNIRVDMRKSRIGNAVLEFPTSREKSQAKKILHEFPINGTKLLDEDDRQISILVHDIPTDNCDTVGLKDELISLNPDLKNTREDDIKIDVWGKSFKRVRLQAPRKIIKTILQRGQLYTEMTRHKVELQKPAPFRCENCLQYHGTSKYHCKKHHRMQVLQSRSWK